jgi:hypothetical protein
LCILFVLKRKYLFIQTKEGVLIAHTSLPVSAVLFVLELKPPYSLQEGIDYFIRQQTDVETNLRDIMVLINYGDGEDLKYCSSECVRPSSQKSETQKEFCLLPGHGKPKVDNKRTHLFANVFVIQLQGYS